MSLRNRLKTYCKHNKMNWLERFCFENRHRRVVICASLRPHRGSGAVLPCAQSLLSAAGKCKPFRRSAFLTKLSAPSSFFLAGCFFHTSFAKEKTHTIVRVFSFGNRRRHTLPGRVQPSTICADELNFCVRYENRWDLIAIDTGNC